MKIGKLVGFIPILLSTVLIVGCDSLPDINIKQAKAIPESIKKGSETISRQKQSFTKLQKSEDWNFLKVYSEREKWDSYFLSAHKELDIAEAIFKDKITPILDRNESKEVTDLRVHTIKANKAIGLARIEAQKVQNRKDFLLKARSNSAKWVSKAQLEISQIDKLFAIAKKFTNKAKLDYPGKAKDINGRFSSLQKLVDDAHIALLISQTELIKVSSNKADYAKLGDSTSIVIEKLKALSIQQPALKKKTDELYKSYSKILKDMRIEYYVVVGRSSWCEGEYCGDGDSKDLPPTLVDEKVFTYFDSYAGDNIAIEGSLGFFKGFGVTPSVPANMWNALKVNKDYNRDSSYDYASFYISKTYTKMYHKYTIIENGVKKDTDWEKVNEGYYWKYEPALGTTIVSKPYGMYENEIIESAAPVGMEYIAKPSIVEGKPTGNNQYGEWRGGFWHYYGQYAFISNLLGPSHRYNYNDWDDYSRRDRRSHYYGRNDSYGTYGHRTYGSNSAYSNSHYAKSNAGAVKEARSSKTNSTSRANRSTGKSQTASVRGAGTSSRGRGPSGGGK